MKSDKSMPMWISISVSCINPLEYRNVLLELDECDVNSYHFDICDGHFAPTFLLNFQIIEEFRKLTKRRFDVHLYCTHPSLYFDALRDCGADIVIIHQEADQDLAELVSGIRSYGLKAGIAILPSSKPTQAFISLLSKVDLIIVNMVGPAYAGQQFDERGLDNLRQIHNEIESLGYQLELAADGNVSEKTLEKLLSAGANHLVCGTSSIFKPTGKAYEHLHEFRKSIEKFTQG